MIALFALLGWHVYQRTGVPKMLTDRYVIVGSSRFKVTIARTEDEQSRGLSGVSRLSKGDGMYFMFDTPRRQSFWNKGMLIPFDLLWIKDNRVLGIEHKVRAEIDGAETVFPPSEIDGAIEIVGDQADNAGISVGDTVKYLW